MLDKDVMKYKTPYNSFTLIELIISVSVLLIISSVLVLKVNPTDSRKKARDNTRLINTAEIDRAINEYLLDNTSYPGLPNTLYKSTNINWIPSSLSKYITVLPIDPLNKDTNFYYYMHNGNSYEINATLEYFSDLMTSDNGNQNSVYEVGNNLTIISGSN